MKLSPDLLGCKHDYRSTKTKGDSHETLENFLQAAANNYCIRDGHRNPHRKRDGSPSRQSHGGGIARILDRRIFPICPEGQFLSFWQIQLLRRSRIATWSGRGTLEGEGVTVIQAANGDLLVGVVTWQIDAEGNGHIAFSWRDSVEFSNGIIVSSTGRFLNSRPAGAVSRLRTISDGTSNIIAILIG